MITGGSAGLFLIKRRYFGNSASAKAPNGNKHQEIGFATERIPMCHIVAVVWPRTTSMQSRLARRAAWNIDRCAAKRRLRGHCRILSPVPSIERGAA